MSCSILRRCSPPDEQTHSRHVHPDRSLATRCELRKVARKEVTRWAAKLVEDRGSDAITSPTVIEMLCGTRNKHELNLTRAYLSKFRVIDEGKITEQDVFHAQRLAAILASWPNVPPAIWVIVSFKRLRCD